MPEAKYVSSEALDAYTQALSQKLNSKLSNIYTPKGSAIYADTAYLASANKASPTINSVGLWQQINGNWAKLTEVMPGWVYNITNEFGGTLYEYIGREQALSLMRYVDEINV